MSIVGRLVLGLFAGPVRWFTGRTWRATADLAVWVIGSCLSAVLAAIGLLASGATVWFVGVGVVVRGTTVEALAQTVRLDHRRLRRLPGVDLALPALPRVEPEATLQERHEAWARSSWLWRLAGYQLIRGAGAALLASAAIAWWWATVACFVLAAHQYTLQYDAVHVFGVALGPFQIVSLGAVLLTALGIVGALLWPTVVRCAPIADVALVRALGRRLLGPSVTELSREVVRLAETRAQAMTGADNERRRIERDLHDGFQPQLVNLALNLGLARSRLASDPESVGPLLDRAHEDAKRATADLRNLVRGIHPSVLDERGLDAAFSALAASSTVPVEIDVQLDRRPPRETEGTAYFVVAEALTNVSKHAGARSAAVTVSEVDGWLWILIQDDGHGGARLESGGGLDGLAARIAGVDGRFSVTSPEGGPTWIEAMVPYGR